MTLISPLQRLIEIAAEEFDQRNYQDWKAGASLSPSESFREGAKKDRELIMIEAERIAEIGFNCRVIKLEDLKKFVGEDLP